MQVIKRLSRYITKRIPLIVYLITLIVIFLINSVHNSFPDEFDNILGGYFINNGIIPYKGFFSHHGLVSYYLASIITLFTKQSFVLFRLVYGLLLAFIVFSYYVLVKKTSKINSNIIVVFGIILGISATYYWGHMLIADSLCALLIIPAYIIFLTKSLNNEPLTNRDLIIISITTALAFFTSLTYIYLIVIINLFSIIMFSFPKLKFSRRNFIKSLIIFISPYLVFLFYFLVTNSLVDFYNQNVLYNKNSYIYNYPRPPGSTTINPVRYAVVISREFLQNFKGLLLQVKDFNLEYPFNITLAVVNTALLIYLITIRRYSLFVFVLSMLIFSNARSNPLTSKETDFQSAVYIVISFFNLSYVLFLLRNSLKNISDHSLKVIYSILYFFSILYSFFFFLYISNNFFEKAYQKYMGLMPLIYDRPEIAPVINQLLTKDDYYWIGPFDFEELFYVNAKLPSRYHWFLRAHSETPSIKLEMINDLKRNPPKLIIYKKDFSSFGSQNDSLNTMIMNILNEDYFQIGSIANENVSYRSKLHLTKYNFDENFYFNKKRKEEILNELLNLGFIEKI